MAIFIEESDYNFLLSSEQFCIHIDKYADILGIDPDAVTEYKTSNELLLYVFHNAGKYPSYAENFLHYQTRKMRMDMAELTDACRNSDKYNTRIGKELGIEEMAFATG